MTPFKIPLEFPRIKTPKGTMLCSGLRPGDWLRRVGQEMATAPNYLDVVVTINSTRLNRVVTYWSLNHGETSRSYGSISTDYCFIGRGHRRRWVARWMEKWICPYAKP